MSYITSAERIGIQKGLEQGKLEGKAEAMKELARNAFKKKKLTVLEIQELTGLSTEELTMIRDSNLH